MFNRQDPEKNEYMLKGGFARKGYDWWWHSFTGQDVLSGDEKTFFIEFFLCNPALAESEPVLGQKEENRKQKKKPSYIMIKAGCWGEDPRQLHRFFAWNEVSVQKGAPFQICAGDCMLSETASSGHICVSKKEADAHPELMSDAGEMDWDLTISKEIAYNVGYGTGRLFRKLEAFEMYWHAAGMKTAYSGTVLFNGRLYKVKPESSYGYADKNWGRNFTSPWIWLSSNHLTSKKTGKPLLNSVFDIGGGRPKIFFAALEKKLLGALYYEGREYEFNFSKFWTRSATKFQCQETEKEIHWKIIQDTRSARLVTLARCQKKEMLLVNYESPDGEKRHKRLWNGGTGTARLFLYERHGHKLTLVDVIDADHVGCEYGEYETPGGGNER